MAHPYDGHMLPERVDRVTLARMLPFVSRAEKNQDPVKHKKPSSDLAILGESLGWPLYLSERQCMAPLIGAVAVAFFATPFILPQTQVGGALLTGYAAGSVIYFTQFFGHRPVSELRGNPVNNV